METRAAPHTSHIVDVRLLAEKVNIADCGLSVHKVIQNVSFDIKEGEKIALVGRNGSGKSTLINLLSGLYSGYQGEMLVEDKSRNKSRNKSEVRDVGNICSFYFQSDYLFDVSIRENIAQNVSIADEKIWEALEAMNYRTDDSQFIYRKCGRTIWQDGLMFSSGEAQKILLSSCLYTDKDIVVLDEPSSNLDPFIERELNELIKRGIDGKTIIFVPHRLSSVLMADRILYVSDGQIKEAGSHKELLARGGEYAGLWNAQTRYYQG